MNNNSEEFRKLKNSIAIKAILKILLYTVSILVLLVLIVDVIYNDQIAESISDISETFYRFLVADKPLIMLIVVFVTFLIVSYFVIRNTMNNMVVVVEAMDKILKNPEKEIKLNNELLILENRLNKIRIDLITSKNIAKEEEQKKNDLIMYMAHDLKTPLTSIIGYLTLLTEEKEISTKMQEKYMKIVLDKSLRVEELINQFFDITRYNLRNMPIKKENINLSFLIDQLIDECYPMLEQRNLKYRIDKPHNIEYFGDGDKLARAFENLLKNAINYSYENSEIQIALKETPEDIQITFKNQGEKIPKYKLDKMFEKFYRIDESRTTKTGGSGLGLAITKEIIELHNGTIEVKNEDEWIEFKIMLKNTSKA